MCCLEIWDALKAATEADLSLAQAIIDSAGIIVSNPDLSLCYDALGILSWFCYYFFSWANNAAIIFSISNHIKWEYSKMWNFILKKEYLYHMDIAILA